MEALKESRQATPPLEPGTAYRVEPPQPGPPGDEKAAEAESRADRKPAARPRRRALFVAHGMGQQVPFQTLDQIAQKLGAETPGGRAPVARTIEVEDETGRERLQRLELTLPDDAEERGECEVHVYEGYWAPLAEGRVTLRDVMSFLFQGGLNGLAVGSRPFRRWLFGSYDCFLSPVRILLYLLLTLAVIGSLVAMNTVIAVVAAARATLGQAPSWLSNALFADLTTTFNAYLAPVLLFGLVLTFSLSLPRTPAWRGRRTALAYLSALFFGLVLVASVLAAVLLLGLVYGHTLPRWRDVEIWPALTSSALVERLNFGVEIAILGILTLAILVAAVRGIFRIVRAAIRELFPPPGEARSKGWLTVLVALFCGLVLAGALGEALRLAILYHGSLAALFVSEDGGIPTTDSRAVLRGGLSWLVLIAVSSQIRRLLIQYLGDVAVCVSSYRLDRFRELRTQIRDCVYRAARAVYARREPDGSQYESVIVVGHSLGSVIVYDVLNRLINDDALAGPGSPRFLDVAARTPTLLTFGSPLDKLVFLFALQSEKTSEPREALAASVQPLIADYGYRPKRWINLHSPWDLISGSLDFFDPSPLDCHGKPRQPAENPKQVQNEVDPDALTLLAAHTQYWDSPLLYQRLHEAVRRG